MITSRQHPIVKEFRDLARGAGPLMLLDGWHLLGEAADARVEVEKIAICGPPTSKEKTVVDRLQRHGALVVDVSGAVLNALSPVNSPTGVVASARIPSITSAAVMKPAPALVLAAAGLQDPGNTGAIIRSSAAAGATGVVLDEQSADPWGWKALRASMGTAFRLPVVRSRALTALIADWKSSGVRIISTGPKGGQSMYDVDFTRPTAVLVGGEGAGLPKEIAALADANVSIPMHAGVESLNAAVAAAVLLYEAQRQRHLTNVRRVR
ncbi:MAG TPA: RNA methyltransferase [Vicinamibacterales bacterium]|nr:RNA methyltransferase [Vicinamibacterales bacterium]